MFNKLSDLKTEKIIYWTSFLLLCKLFLAVCQSMTDYVILNLPLCMTHTTEMKTLKLLCSLDPYQLLYVKCQITVLSIKLDSVS